MSRMRAHTTLYKRLILRVIPHDKYYTLRVIPHDKLLYPYFIQYMGTLSTIHIKCTLFIIMKTFAMVNYGHKCLKHGIISHTFPIVLRVKNLYRVH